jgi:squalene synthase HpnC
MARARQENFRVASLLLPRTVRSHLLAVYGFARLVDDAGDEAPGDRLELLDEIEADLERVWSSRPRNPLIARLQPTVSACELDIDPFRRLIEANRRDQVVHSYETFEDLLGYCALSANPVGELVLRIFGFATEERLRLSDKVCSALQLTEHWQDVAEDHASGRIYLPTEDLARFGVAEEDLGLRTAGPELRELIAFEVRRARALLDEGAPLARTLPRRPAFAVAGFVAGGRAALGAIEHANYDVLVKPTRASLPRRAVEFTRMLGRVAT